MSMFCPFFRSFRSLNFPLLILFVSGLWLVACSTPILKPAETLEWNEELEKQVFRAKTDIFPEFANQADKDDPLFKRGTLLKIQIESSPDWVKVRAREARKDRENTPGRVILYLFQTDVDTEQGNGRQVVTERLNQLLSPAN